MAEVDRAVRIRPFAPGDEAAFHDINTAWIRRYFAVEDKDREVLGDPHGKILDKGGAILMATIDEAAGSITIGCIALLAMGGGTWELAKMGVTPEAQGRGAGRKLIEAAIAEARGLGARRLYLETNSSLAPALKLYADAGFRPVAGPPSAYARADVQMELLLA